MMCTMAVSELLIDRDAGFRLRMRTGDVTLLDEDVGGRIISFEGNDARPYAELVSERRRRGRTISQFDAQIVALGLVLLSGSAPVTSSPDDGDNEFGSELRRRASPKFARLQRRQALWAGLLGLGLGLMCLALGVDSMGTGEWVIFGRPGTSVLLPGWSVTLIGLFLLFIGCWILRQSARRT